MSGDMKKYVCVSVSIIVVSALVICGFGAFRIVSAASVPSENVKQEKLYLKVAMQSDVKTLNPSTATDVWTWNVIGWIWEGTIIRDPDTLEIKPWIALEWRNWTRVDEKGNIVGDYMNWTVIYRTGKYNTDKALKFHDGHVVDIYDIVFSYALALRIPRWAPSLDALDKTPNGTVVPPEGEGKYGGIPMIKGISIINDHTLRIKLNFTYAEFETDILGIPIFPWHAWRDHFDPADRSVFEYWDMDDDGNPANGAPGMLGCGMFKFVKWDKVAFYSELETYKDFFPWNKKPPNWNKEWYWETKIDRFTRKPYSEGNHVPIIDGIKFKIYMKTDLAVMALKKGEVDYIAWAIDPSYIPELEADENIGLSATAETGFFYCAFNMRKLPFGYDDKGNDIGLPLRKAIAYATDKETIVSKLLQGYGAVGTSPINPGNTYWYNPYVPTYPYDLEKAKKILDDQGWTDKNGNGWRELPGVGDAQLTLIHPTADYDYIRAEAARMLAESLRKIGLNVKNQPLDFGELVNRVSARNMDFYFLGWRVGLEPGYLYDFFHSSQIGPGLNNGPGYQDDEFDAVIEAARKELDPEKRRELIWECQKIIAEKLPYNVLYYRDQIEGYRKVKFAGWYPIIGGIFNGWSLTFIHKTKMIMNLEMSLPENVMAGGSSMELALLTTDKEGKPVAEVATNLTAKSPAIGISPGSYREVSGYPFEEGTIVKELMQIRYAMGNTKSKGEFKIKYVAPELKENETLTVTFEASGLKEGYDPAFASPAVIDIYSPLAKVLKSKITFGSDIIQSGESTTITAKVLSLLDEPMAGVEVSVSSRPATGVTFDAKNKTTNELGIAKFVFTVDLPPDVESEEYTITVEVKKPEGWLRAYSDTEIITVKQVTAPPAEGFNVLYIIIPVIIIVVVVAVIWYLRMRRL